MTSTLWLYKGTCLLLTTCPHFVSMVGAGRGFGGRGAPGRGRGYDPYGGGFDAGYGYEDTYMDDGYGGYGAPYDGYGDPYGGYGVAPAAGALVPMVLPNGQARAL